MIRINKTLHIKYKTAISVFENINQVAYATQSRPLCTNTKQVNTILSHPTFCDSILPVLIGRNSNASDWEMVKTDYISSLQLNVPSSGYPLELSSTYDSDNKLLSVNIAKYIKDNNLKDKTEKEVVYHIVENVEPINYHLYFKYDNVKDYLFWIMALTSSQVANTPEDFDKSNNIRFFIYDDKVAKKKILKDVELREKAAQEAIKLKSKKDILGQIALMQNILTIAELEEITVEDLYIEIFNYANSVPDVFLNILKDEKLEIKSTIKTYIEYSILKINDENNIVDGKNESIVIGGSIEEAVRYFENPINSAEVTKYGNEYKSAKK